MPKSPIRVLFVTVPSEETAAAIARALVEERLVACVNIVPGIRSVYRWQGAIADEAEILLVCKTSLDRVPAATARVKELHPYQVPEAISLVVEDGLPGYLAWVCDETRSQVA
jgi:periplasmic divalent cation tolerance protein